MRAWNLFAQEVLDLHGQVAEDHRQCEVFKRPALPGDALLHLPLGLEALEDDFESPPGDVGVAKRGFPVALFNCPKAMVAKV